MDHSYFGLHIHRADRGSPWPDINFGSWRLWDAHVSWADLQPRATEWNFSRLDEYVNLARSHGVTILLPLGLSPWWASARPLEPSAYGPGLAAEPRDLQDWRTYVRTVARRYRGIITAFEIWNEPNSPSFFSGTTDALVDLTREAYLVLKKEDSNTIVVSPAYTGLQHTDTLSEFLVKGGKNYIDVVAYHLYVTPEYPEAIPAVVDKIKQVMSVNGVGHLPLWNTETGWWMANTDGTPETGVAPPYWKRIEGNAGAAVVARALILAKASRVERFYWYSWDSPSFGLIEPFTKQYKAGALAFRKMAGWLSDKTIVSCKGTGGQWVCNLRNTAGNRFDIAWNTEGVSGRYLIPTRMAVLSIESAGGSTVATGPQLREVATSTEPLLLELGYQLLTDSETQTMSEQNGPIKSWTVDVVEGDGTADNPNRYYPLVKIKDYLAAAAGERLSASATSSYVAIRNEANLSVISKTTTVTINTGAVGDTHLIGIYIVAALTGTCVITGFGDSDGNPQTITLPAATTAGFKDFVGALNSEGALTVTCSNAADDNLVLVFWKPASL